jgi:hypothetical protein
MVQTQVVDTQSLTFQSNNSNPNILNREFFMIQEEDSHQELDQNLKFIEELLKESDDQDLKKMASKPPVKRISSLHLPSEAQPSSMHESRSMASLLSTQQKLLPPKDLHSQLPDTSLVAAWILLPIAHL